MVEALKIIIRPVINKINIIINSGLSILANKRFILSHPTYNIITYYINFELIFLKLGLNNVKRGGF